MIVKVLLPMDTLLPLSYFLLTIGVLLSSMLRSKQPEISTPKHTHHKKRKKKIRADRVKWNIKGFKSSEVKVKKQLNTAKKLSLIMMLSHLQHLQLPSFSYFVCCLFLHIHLFVALSWIKYKIPCKCLTRSKAALHSKYSYCHQMSCSVHYRILRNWEGKLCFSRETWYLNNGDSFGLLCLFYWCLLPVSCLGSTH